MLVFIFYVVIIILILKYAYKNSSINTLALSVINSKFSNVSPVHATSELSVYRADKAGENFLFALKNVNSHVSVKDLNILYDLSCKLHIHSKIIITNEVINTSSLEYKKLKEYNMQVWDSSKLHSMLNETDYSNSSTPLSTSDTSADNCEIDESFDPIQDGTFNTHGIFSIFNNKVDHL